jgi:hypothetical protein
MNSDEIRKFIIVAGRMARAEGAEAGFADAEKS